MVKKIIKLALDDRRLKLRERADMVGISKTFPHCIMTEDMGMRKLCARWVQRLLKMKQKHRRENFSIKCLTMFHSNKSDILRRLITIDGTWAHH